MSQPAWTLTGSLKTPDGHPHAGVTVKVTPRGQIVNDPVGSDLRAASATAVIDADGTLPPMSIVAQDGVYFTVSVPVLGTVTIASPAAGATLTLDDVFTALAVSPPAAGVVQQALDAIDARLDALEAGGAGGGVTDHGALTGLGDDDHPQYTTAAEAAAAAPVQSVAGRAGAVTLTKADVGLSAVDNTADADKPISTATATALAGKAPTVHTHAASHVTDSTAVGRSVLTAADAAAARTAIGAGTSSLAIGTTVGTAAEGNDPRLSDARTPAAHAASHAAAGSDPVTVTALAAGSTDASKVLAPTVGGGLQWVTPAGGGGDGTAVRHIPGRWHMGLISNLGNPNVAMTAGTMLFLPFLGAPQNIDGMNVQVGTAQAGAILRLGIYAPGTDGRPAALIVDCGTVDASTTGNKTSLITAVALPAGLVWLGVVSSVTGVTVYGGNSSAVTTNCLTPLGGTNPNHVPTAAVSYAGWTADSPLPSTASVTGETFLGTTSAPAIWIRSAT